MTAASGSPSGGCASDDDSDAFPAYSDADSVACVGAARARGAGGTSGASSGEGSDVSGSGADSGVGSDVSGSGASSGEGSDVSGSGSGGMSIDLAGGGGLFDSGGSGSEAGSDSDLSFVDATSAAGGGDGAFVPVGLTSGQVADRRDAVEAAAAAAARYEALAASYERDVDAERLSEALPGVSAAPGSAGRPRVTRVRSDDARRQRQRKGGDLRGWFEAGFGDGAGEGAGRLGAGEGTGEGVRGGALGVQRSAQPCDDYESGAWQLYEAFWPLFVLRRGLVEGRAVRASKVRHLMLYYDNRFAQDPALLFHLADVQMRHAVNRAVAARVKSSGDAFREFSETVNSAEYLDLLKAYEADRSADHALKVVKRVCRFMSLTGAKVPHGNEERKAEITHLLARERFSGTASNMLNAAPDDVHMALNNIWAAPYDGPGRFPASPPAEFFEALRSVRYCYDVVPAWESVRAGHPSPPKSSPPAAFGASARAAAKERAELNSFF